MLCGPRRSPGDDGNDNRGRSWFKAMRCKNCNDDEEEDDRQGNNNDNDDTDNNRTLRGVASPFVSAARHHQGERERMRRF